MERWIRYYPGKENDVSWLDVHIGDMTHYRLIPEARKWLYPVDHFPLNDLELNLLFMLNPHFNDTDFISINTNTRSEDINWKKGENVMANTQDIWVYMTISTDGGKTKWR